MILTFDIGNTNITFGGFEEEKLVFVANISTDIVKTSDEYAGGILNIFNLHAIDKNAVDGAIIASVVPSLTSVITRAVEFVFGIKPIVVGPGIKTGINIHCDIPSSVGADLICDCVAAHYIYGSPSLIIDLGTATKMIVVNEKGAFVGVSIIPGVSMGMNALVNCTAQLPQVSIEAPREVIAKNTVDSMRSGVIYGNASMIDGMIDRIRTEFRAQLPVIVTGGMAEPIIKYCEREMLYDKNLLLKGLNILYNKNK